MQIKSFVPINFDFEIMKKPEEVIFSYWGKADPNYPGEQKWHPLVYHSLDVAAVGFEYINSGVKMYH